jgi:N-acetylneuraminic acid mutarotase
MKNKNLFLRSTTSVFIILFCMMFFGFSAAVNAQVLFNQSVDADFHRGHYSDMIVASNNVTLPFYANDINNWLTTTVLPQTLTRHKAATWNNRFVYVAGGYNGVSHSNAVYRATLQTSGISTWTTLGSLPVALSNHALVIGHNTIYVIGGRDESNIYNTIYYATINTNGTIGDWQTSSVSLPTGLWGHTAVYCSGYIYVAGGSDQLDDDSANDDVYYAKVLADNTLSDFVATTSLPSSLNGHTMEINGEEVFVLGGFEDGGTKVNTVYKTSSNADGSLNAWTAQTALPHAVSYHSSVVINGIITVLAGETGTGLTKNIYYADINAGSLSWTAGSEMTDFSKGGVAYASNGQIIYSGGENLSETPVHNSRYVPLTLSANRKVDGLFISTPFTQLGDERYIDELIFTRTIGAGSNIELSYRLAGNDKIWGDWIVLSSTSPITVDNTARYLQYKVVFTSDGIDNASLHSVTLSTPGTQLSGNLNAIPTFTAAASPYWITGDISFTAGTHTFEAGTRFLFMPGVRMEVGAANIICNGVAGDSVYFTGYTDEQGLWGGIYFNGSSSSGVSSQFDYVVISNAGSGTYAANLYCLNTSQPTLNNCDIRGSTANGIRMNNAHIMIENSRIHHNELDGLSLTNSSPTVNSSIIDYNGLAGVWHNSTTSNPNYFSSEISNNLYGIHYDSPNYTFLEPNGSPVLSDNTYNGIVLNGGSVSSNSVWNKINYDYIILADIVIRGNPIRLTIEPGNTIRTAEDAKIQVAQNGNGGELYAIGTETEPIVFTSWNGNPGGWNGIFFHTHSDAYNSSPSVLDYCIIENANEYNIFADGTDVRILNSTIQGAAHDGIRFSNSTGLIENCIIQNSGQYGLLLTGTSPGSTPEIRDCQFLNNSNYPLFIETTQCNRLPENNTYIGNTPNYIAYGGGTINWDRTFYNEGIPYHILDNITFGQNNVPTLTIEAGNTLTFNPDVYLQIGYSSFGSKYGTLIAEGMNYCQLHLKPTMIQKVVGKVYILTQEVVRKEPMFQ